MLGYTMDCCTVLGVKSSSAAAAAVGNPLMMRMLEVHLFYTHVTYAQMIGN